MTLPQPSAFNLWLAAFGLWLWCSLRALPATAFGLWLCHSLRAVAATAFGLWLWYSLRAVPATAFGLWLPVFGLYQPQPAGCGSSLRAVALVQPSGCTCHSLRAVALVQSSGCTTAFRLWLPQPSGCGFGIVFGLLRAVPATAFGLWLWQRS